MHTEHPHTDDIKRQHDDLRRRCADLLALVADDAPWTTVEEALALAEEVLSGHFEVEELGGYLSWVLEKSPAEDGTVRRLRGEHDDLWGRLKQLQKLAAAASDRAAFRAELEAWAALLGRHESEETSIAERHSA